MIIGQVLHAAPSASPPSPATTTYFTTWFSSGGNLIGVACDVIQTQGLSAFKITVETKLREDDDNSRVTVGSFESISLSAGIHKFKRGATVASGHSGLKELVRYRLDLETNTNQLGWVHFRVLNPTWLAN
jgi:hypothetical protein